MDAAQIHRQFAVDEDPNIIVTHEAELVGLLRIVLEPIAHLGGKAEVVLLARGIHRPAWVIVARNLAERTGAEGRQTICGEEEWIAVESGFEKHTFPGIAFDLAL